jgi:hypothetical protein
MWLMDEQINQNKLNHTDEFLNQAANLKMNLHLEYGIQHKFIASG